MNQSGKNRRTLALTLLLPVLWLLFLAHRILDMPFLLGYTGYADMYGGVRVPLFVPYLLVILLGFVTGKQTRGHTARLVNLSCALVLLAVYRFQPFSGKWQGPWSLFSFFLFGGLLFVGWLARSMIYSHQESHVPSTNTAVYIATSVNAAPPSGVQAQSHNPACVLRSVLAVLVLLAGDGAALWTNAQLRHLPAFALSMLALYVSFGLFTGLTLDRFPYVSRPVAAIILLICLLPIPAMAFTLMQVVIPVNPLTSAILAFHDPWIGPFYGFASGMSIRSLIHG